MIYLELVENEFLSPQESKQIKIDTVAGNTYATIFVSTLFPKEQIKNS
ncbi:hypothetical protein [Candidatus Nitrosocosmicus sp. T]